MIWFYSDPHFDHTNIIRYCNRPFLSVADAKLAILREIAEQTKIESDKAVARLNEAGK